MGAEATSSSPIRLRPLLSKAREISWPKVGLYVREVIQPCEPAGSDEWLVDTKLAPEGKRYSVSIGTMPTS